VLDQGINRSEALLRLLRIPNELLFHEEIGVTGQAHTGGRGCCLERALNPFVEFDLHECPRLTSINEGYS
jgi:hypothetical protein